MEQRMLCPALESALRTAARTCSTSSFCGSGFVAGWGCAATAGAADPMTTGAELVAAEAGREGGALPSTENSDRGVPLRAESAANGETKDRGGVHPSGFLRSGARGHLRSGGAR